MAFPETIIGLFVLVCTIVVTSFHTVNQGYISVYYRGGAILDTIGEPGWNMMLPFITSFSEVQVTVQTDKVNDVICGTAGGVLITFGQIEVVNRLSKTLALETVRNYTVDYDKTWIFDKIQ